MIVQICLYGGPHDGEKFDVPQLPESAYWLVQRETGENSLYQVIASAKGCGITVLTYGYLRRGHVVPMGV